VREWEVGAGSGARATGGGTTGVWTPSLHAYRVVKTYENKLKRSNCAPNRQCRRFGTPTVCADFPHFTLTVMWGGLGYKYTQSAFKIHKSYIKNPYTYCNYSKTFKASQVLH
jgi:hypothetical protein